MTAHLARTIIRAAAWLVPPALRDRWREEWLAEIYAAGATRTTPSHVFGACWDALTTRWTTRPRVDRPPIVWVGRRGELKQAYRSLKKAPWYSLTVASVVALTMTLAITVFAIVDGLLFKPLAYPEASRLFGIATEYSKVPDSVRSTASTGTVTQFDEDAWKDALPEVRFTAFYSSDWLTTGTDEAVPAARVDPAFFDVIGIKPVVGGFSTSDFDEYAKIRPAVITDAFWIRRFGADRSIVGRAFVGDAGVGFRVVGILPSNFVFPHYAAADALTPLIRDRAPSRGSSLHVLARLPAGLSELAASSRLDVAAKQLTSLWPAPPARPNLSERQRLMRGHFDTARFEPIRAAMTDLSSQTAWLRFWTAVLLLVLAGVNITGLALARLQDRWRELALRRVLGARYADLARLLFYEFALLITVGTAAGAWAAGPTLLIIVRLMSKSSQFLKVAVIDLRVVAFAAVTAAVCVGVTTLVTARAAWRGPLRSVISQGGAATRRVRRSGGIMVCVQVALAMVTTIIGALIGGSLIRVLGESSGFDDPGTGVLNITSRVGLTGAESEELMNRFRQIPGVAHIGGVDKSVLALAFNGSEFDRPAGVTLTTIVESMSMTADYLPAAGLAPIAGRLPTHGEFESGASVIVVSEIVADQYWPGQSALGQSLTRAGHGCTVVGVVPDVRYVSFDLAPQGAIYSPMAATAHTFPYYTLVRFAKDRTTPLAEVTAAIEQRCPACVVRTAETIQDALDATIKPRRLNAWLFSALGGVALVIVGAGILGLVAMTTSRRTREIGIRMALGATRDSVVWQILNEQLTAVAVGVLAGGVSAAWAVRFVGEFLYKTPMFDARSWVAGVAVLLTVSTLGALLPSLRASRIDPVTALRVE